MSDLVWIAVISVEFVLSLTAVIIISQEDVRVIDTEDVEVNRTLVAHSFLVKNKNGCGCQKHVQYANSLLML
jgi:hypothetical protein